MILLAFDVDFTLDTSAGPVVWAKVKTHENPVSLVLGIVSPSGARPKDDTPAYLPDNGGSRRANLRAFAEAHQAYAAAAAGYPVILVYVSDNKDYAEAEAAGFCYVEAAEFAKGIP